MVKVYNAIEQHFHGGYYMVVYRAITAPEDWSPTSDRLGRYWTWDRDSAFPHWGERGDASDHVRWLITAKINRDQIDWLDTIVANAAPSSTDEREITLRQSDMDVDVLSIERDSAPIPLTK